MTQSTCDNSHLVQIAGGLALAAGLGVIAAVWLRHWRGHNPLVEANRIIESLNDKIGDLETQVHALRVRP
jgi:hypothetical protein